MGQAGDGHRSRWHDRVSTGPHLHFEFRQLTPEGWVAMDAGAQLEYALAQLITAMQVAQAKAASAAKG